MPIWLDASILPEPIWLAMMLESWRLSVTRVESPISGPPRFVVGSTSAWSLMMLTTSL